jgi:MEMO1 family protein
MIVAGWVAPHGVVADMPAKNLALVPLTDAAMRAAAERIVSLAPDSVVLVTPHGFRAADANTVSFCRHNAVKLDVWYPWRADEMRVDSDIDLARQILESAHEHEVPAVGLIYGATSDPVYPMDWAITAPMRYLLDAGYQGTLVPVTFTDLPFENEWRFGTAIANAVSRSGKHVALIASSDLSHVHSPDGPYGYNPIAPEFDATIEHALRTDDVASLLRLDPDWVAEAAQDGLRSILILAGAIEGSGFTPDVLAYEVMVYFGMLTAIFD